MTGADTLRPGPGHAVHAPVTPAGTDGSAVYAPGHGERDPVGGAEARDRSRGEQSAWENHEQARGLVALALAGRPRGDRPGSELPAPPVIALKEASGAPGRGASARPVSVSSVGL